MKVTTGDLRTILRRFNIADETSSSRDIDQVKQSHPSPINQLVSFRYLRTRYYALFDETAEDHMSYIMTQLHTAKSELRGELLKNPQAHVDTYGLPFKGKDVYLFQEVSDKTRLDHALTERYPDINRSTWQKHIKEGHVSVNDAVVTSPSQEVQATDRVAVNLPEKADFSAQELPILYIDDDVIVINKPIGVLTHSKGALNDEFTVADFFRRYSSVGLDTNRPGIVHRLDRDTSGVMIGARTPEAFALLKEQFSDRKAKKTYLALVKGELKLPAARIDVPIGRNPAHPSTFRSDSNGKPAVTDYETLIHDGSLSLVRLQPLTGRTHQLRVHLAHLGHPIFGDRVYGKPADRLYLHAYSLEITIPVSTRMTFTAEIPPEFSQLLPEVADVEARV